VQWRSEARDSPEAARIFLKVGKAIRAARQAKELTLEELAERAHLSPQHLLDIEHGRTNVTLASLAGIARGLGARLRDLFEGA
jgi:transcriptional regulator with XRE-family HTH domain